jgi:hypothetical protein
LTTIEDLAADLETVKASTPTLEEQLFSQMVPCWNNGADRLTGGNAMTFLVAPIPLRILSISMSFEYWNIAASNSNYWTLSARKGSNTSGWATFAERSTQSTGGNANGPVASRTPWTFDGATWGNADLQAGDLLRMDFVPTGNPADLDMPFTITVRYRAL